MLRNLTYLFLAGIILISCSKEELPPKNQQSGNELENGWLVPVNQLVLSQLPPDRIHSIDNPHFAVMGSHNLRSDETVYVYRHENIVKIYTQSVMGVHEIVNDHIGDHHFAVTFCPLTGSAVAWNREVNGTVSEFGVSGHLFNENLIPYDRNNNSFWSQMLLEGIKGMHGGEQLENEFLLMTTGGTIKNAFPGALVLVDTSSHNCDSICGDFKQGHDLGDPGENDVELPGGDLFGVISRESALLFNFDDFDENIKVYHVGFGSAKLIVAGSKGLQFITAFKDNTGDPNIQFYPVQNAPSHHF